jgi:hypothetical protein
MLLPKKKKFRKDFFGKIREVHKESLGDSLKRVVENEKLFNFKESLSDTKLTKRWLEIVGKNLSALTIVKANKTGTLTIEAKGSVVVQEIKLMQNEILQKFKEGEPVYVFKKILIKSKL